jgi:RHS repeat-associated protein
MTAEDYTMMRTIIGTVLALLTFMPRVAQAQTEQVFYYHTDAIGSVRMITDETGQVVARYDYLPFGEVCDLLCQNEPAPDQRRQFAGKERDQQTGLDYFGARYYASQTGRFTTVDPLIVPDAALVDPQRWNRYGYVRNNPLRFFDPTGLYIASCTDDVKKCDDEIERFDKALQQALKSKDEAIRTAAAAYGARGVDNGVNVSFVKTVDPKYRDVTGMVTAQAETGGMRVVGSTLIQATQVFVKAGMTGSQLASTLIHEGVHVEDRAAFIATIDIANNTWTQSLNITARQSERNAYGVENLYWAQIRGPQRNIPQILSRPPYSVNPNIDKPLFPLLVP